MGTLYGDAKANRSRHGVVFTGLFPRLRERQKQLAGTLSGGDTADARRGQRPHVPPQAHDVRRAFLGLAPILVQDIFRIVRRSMKNGVTVLLVEQNVAKRWAMCHRAYVLENGRVVLEGTGQALMANQHVKEAYLGI